MELDFQSKNILQSCAILLVNKPDFMKRVLSIPLHSSAITNNLMDVFHTARIAPHDDMRIYLRNLHSVSSSVKDPNIRQCFTTLLILQIEENFPDIVLSEWVI